MAIFWGDGKRNMGACVWFMCMSEPCLCMSRIWQYNSQFWHGLLRPVVCSMWCSIGGVRLLLSPAAGVCGTLSFVSMVGGASLWWAGPVPVLPVLSLRATCSSWECGSSSSLSPLGDWCFVFSSSSETLWTKVSVRCVFSLCSHSASLQGLSILKLWWYDSQTFRVRSSITLKHWNLHTFIGLSSIILILLSHRVQ